MRKLLLYNWERIGGPNGGGVARYLMELMEELLLDGEYEIFFLNSGRKYTEDGQLRIEETCNPFGMSVHSYEVFNSPVLSPGNQSGRNLEKYVLDETLHLLLEEFIQRKGIEIVHYHNIEGLTQRTLELKKSLSNVSFFCTLHNYYPICPEVNLWSGDKEICRQKELTECSRCYPYANYDLTVFRFCHLDIPGLKDIFLDYSIKHPDGFGDGLVEKFRRGNVSAFNDWFDAVLVPSQKTKDIYVSMGVLPDRLFVSYAGSKIAGNQIQKQKNYSDEVLHIVYMGYLRRDKGFYFFLEALKEIPRDYAEKIAVTFLVHHDNLEEEVNQFLREDAKNYVSIEFGKGFKDYDELVCILSRQDLGIIPILWEDPLPRIAMEQIACGVPILASDLGGTKELIGNAPEFIFPAGDKEVFIQKLVYFVKHKKSLECFWKQCRKLVTMKEHVENLRSYYGVNR